MGKFRVLSCCPGCCVPGWFFTLLALVVTWVMGVRGNHGVHSDVRNADMQELASMKQCRRIYPIAVPNYRLSARATRTTPSGQEPRPFKRRVAICICFEGCVGRPFPNATRSNLTMAPQGGGWRGGPPGEGGGRGF